MFITLFNLIFTSQAIRIFSLCSRSLLSFFAMTSSPSTPDWINKQLNEKQVHHDGEKSLMDDATVGCLMEKILDLRKENQLLKDCTVTHQRRIQRLENMVGVLKGVVSVMETKIGKIEQVNNDLVEKTRNRRRVKKITRKRRGKKSRSTSYSTNRSFHQRMVATGFLKKAVIHETCFFLHEVRFDRLGSFSPRALIHCTPSKPEATS